jgi:hypothetical protein
MLTVPVVLIGVAIALCGLLAVVLDRFWPVALIVLILLGFGVMQAGADCHVWLDKLPEGLKNSTIAEHLVCALDPSRLDPGLPPGRD